MRIALLGTRTGQGHVSVINALRDAFEQQGATAVTFPDFAEEMFPGNRLFCEFYNYLLTSSAELANAYIDFLVHSRHDTDENYCRMSERFIAKFLDKNNFDLIITAAPFTTYALAYALQKRERPIPFYIMVTDPFVPIMAGFECPGADGYFVATPEVKSVLVAEGIEAEKVEVTGYPVRSAFLETVKETERGRICAKYRLDPSEKIIICNSGAAGNPSFLKYLLAFMEADSSAQFIFIAGRNQILEHDARTLATDKADKRKDNVKIMGYVDDMPELLAIADFLITKPGANSVFEAIYSDTALIIDGTTPFLYQEKGIEAFIQEYRVGNIVRSIDDFLEFLRSGLTGSPTPGTGGNGLKLLPDADPAQRIASIILNRYREEDAQ